MTAARDRDYTVDLIKTVAIFDVVLSHVAVPAFSMGAVGTAPWLVALFWGCVSHISVSLFLMASGALLLEPAKPMPMRKLFTKNMPRLLIALLFWAVCYKIYHLIIFDQLTAAALVRSIKEVILFRHEEHLYYLHIMLLVYAFLPITRLVAEKAERRQLEYLLGLWFLLGILYPTVRTLWPFTLLVGIPKQWLMNMTYASIGYTLLGRYMTAYGRKVRRWIWWIFALAGFASAFAGCWVGSAAAGTLDAHFMEGMGVPMCLLAVGVYGLCQSVTLPPTLCRFVAYGSKASFCIFLTHVFFLKTFSRLGINALMGSAAVTVPLVSILIIGCSCLAYELLRRIPVVNRYLI